MDIVVQGLTSTCSFNFNSFTCSVFKLYLLLALDVLQLMCIFTPCRPVGHPEQVREGLLACSEALTRQVLASPHRNEPFVGVLVSQHAFFDKDFFQLTISDQ